MNVGPMVVASYLAGTELKTATTRVRVTKP